MYCFAQNKDFFSGVLVEVGVFSTEINILPLQVRRALSGRSGGCLCQWELKAPTDRSQSDCVHEQVAKADCECPLYITNHIIITLLLFRQFSHRLDCRLHFFLSIVMGKTKPHSALLNRSKRLMHQRCTMSAWSCRNLPSFKQFITDL